MESLAYSWCTIQLDETKFPEVHQSDRWVGIFRWRHQLPQMAEFSRVKFLDISVKDIVGMERSRSQNTIWPVVQWRMDQLIDLLF